MTSYVMEITYMTLSGIVDVGINPSLGRNVRISH